MNTAREGAVNRLDVSAYTIPTATPESDGTLEWNATTMVLVEVEGAGGHGLGYGYADVATARFIEEHLREVVIGHDALAPTRAWMDMVHAVRNLGRPGVSSMAVSAVDAALWDLKAKVLGLPLFRLLGAVRDGIVAYGSGGFTSYTDQQLTEQLGGWAEAGLTRVKMKVGRDPEDDLHRVNVARTAIGPEMELFVDANGAYTRKQALALANGFAAAGVRWFEEPVSSDDLEGLHLIRDRAPAGMDIAAGEYGYDLVYFRRMLEAEAVDVLQADATRCGGVTGFLSVAPLCQARCLPLSAHTAPSLHAHLCCAAIPACNVEYFFDHARIEHILFDGALTPVGGELRPDPSRPGLGLEFRRQDARRYAV